MHALSSLTYRSLPRRLFSHALSIAFGVLLLPPSDVQGAVAVPEWVHYQGILRTEGQAANGSFPLKFTIYDAATAGNALWSETQTVAVTDGTFSLMLGGVSPLGATVFDGAERWLGITVAEEPELTPRQRFGAAPYALQAAQVQRIGAGTVIAGNTTTGILVALFGEGPVEGPREEVAPGTAVVGITRSTANDAAGIHGIASATAGETAGLRGESWSEKGTGVVGRAAAGGASAGTGVYGETAGELGAGVTGVATSSAGLASGGTFTSMADKGFGVRGAGSACGGEFASMSPDGIGVSGWAMATTGKAYGGNFVTVSSEGVGVMGQAQAGGASAGTGVYGETAGELGAGVTGVATSSAGLASGGSFTSMADKGFGVRGAGSACGGEFASMSPGGIGVSGLAMATTGNAYGGKFVTLSSDGIAVLGQAGADVGTTYGVTGETASSDAAAAGVLGKAGKAASGGRFESGSGTGVRIKSSTGNIIEGYNAGQLAFKVDNKGNVFADGTFQSPAADFAEMLPGAPDLEPGDVLAVGPDGQVTKAGGEKAHAVIGVYSTQPAFLGGAGPSSASAGSCVPVAILGVVPVKASAENGPIQPNDSLSVSKSKAGRAAKAVPLFVLGSGEAVYAGGTLVGRALEGLEQGDGVIQVLVQLR